jgi:hypothetical protein
LPRLRQLASLDYVVSAFSTTVKANLTLPEFPYFAMLKISQTRSYSVPVVERTCDILELLESSDVSLRSNQIADLTHISRTTTYRIMRTLVQRGYVVQNLDGSYALAAGRVGRILPPRVSSTSRGFPFGPPRREMSSQEIVQMLSSIVEFLRR